MLTHIPHITARNLTWDYTLSSASCPQFTSALYFNVALTDIKIHIPLFKHLSHVEKPKGTLKWIDLNNKSTGLQILSGFKKKIMKYDKCAKAWRKDSESEGWGQKHRQMEMWKELQRQGAKWDT